MSVNPAPCAGRLRVDARVVVGSEARYVPAHLGDLHGVACGRVPAGRRVGGRAGGRRHHAGAANCCACALSAGRQRSEQHGQRGQYSQYHSHVGAPSVVVWSTDNTHRSGPVNPSDRIHCAGLNDTDVVRSTGTPGPQWRDSWPSDRSVCDEICLLWADAQRQAGRAPRHRQVSRSGIGAAPAHQVPRLATSTQALEAVHVTSSRVDPAHVVRPACCTSEQLGDHHRGEIGLVSRGLHRLVARMRDYLRARHARCIELRV